MPHHPQSRIKNFFNYSATLTGAQTDEVLVAAPGDGFRICLTDIAINPTADGNLTLEHGSTALVLTYAQTNELLVWNLNTPLMGQNNTALTITSSAGNVSVNLSGYILS